MPGTAPAGVSPTRQGLVTPGPGRLRARQAEGPRRSGVSVGSARRPESSLLYIGTGVGAAVREADARRRIIRPPGKKRDSPRPDGKQDAIFECSWERLNRSGLGMRFPGRSPSQRTRPGVRGSADEEAGALRLGLLASAEQQNPSPGRGGGRRVSRPSVGGHVAVLVPTSRPGRSELDPGRVPDRPRPRPAGRPGCCLDLLG